MTHTPNSDFWKINKAGVLIEAMDLAAKAGHQGATRSSGKSIYDSSRSWFPVSAEGRSRPTAANHKLTPRFAAIMFGIGTLSGFLVANWIT